MVPPAPGLLKVPTTLLLLTVHVVEAAREILLPIKVTLPVVLATMFVNVLLEMMTDPVKVWFCTYKCVPEPTTLFTIPRTSLPVIVNNAVAAPLELKMGTKAPEDAAL